MNHIYKVIWNKAKHCYTVVSEIAKNHSTSSVTKKKVSIAAILAVGMLSGFSPMVSGAADTTNSGAVVYDQNQTSLKSTNSNGVGKNAIALGKGASAVDDSIAIGNGASVVGGSHGKGGVALGKNAHAGYKGTSLGNSAISGREGTIVIGDTTNVQSLYSTVVGTDSTITSDGTPYTAFGKSVIVQGAVSTSFGAHNTSTNKDKKIFSGVANSIIGSVNTVTNSNGVTIQGTGNTVSNAYKDMNIGPFDLLDFKKGDYSSLAKKDSGAIAIIGGGNTISDQRSSTVIGFGNTLKGKNSTGVFTAGSQNTLTNVSNSLVMGDKNTLKDRKNVISLGNQNTVTADDAVAIGNGATVEAKGEVAIGTSSVAKGDHSIAIGNESNVDADDGLAIGYQSKIIKGSLYEHGTSESTVLGNQSVIGADAHLSTIIGAHSEIEGLAEYSTIIGARSSIAWNASSSTAVGEGTHVYKACGTALGAGSKVKGNYGTALGTNSSVTEDSDFGVAIGYASKADRPAGVLGYLADRDTTDITWKASIGAVSVGSSAAKYTRQITNVAAGTDDTDAVNVAQLKKVNSKADSATEMANKGWNLTTGASDATQVKPGDTVDFSGDKNISVSHKGTDVSIALKDTLTLGSNATDGYVTVDGVKGTVWAGHAVSAGNVNMDGDSGEITGLTNTTLNSKDFATTGRAATEEQLKLVKNQADSAATEASKHSKVVNGSNITVEETDQDGQKTYKVGLNKNLEGIESISNGDAKINLNDTGVVISKGKDKTFSITDTGMGMSVIGDDYVTRSIMVGKNGTVISGGLSVAGSKITNVAAGSEDTDAVNVGQLKEAVEAGNTDTHIKAGEYGVGTDNKVNMQLVDKNGKDAGTVTITDVAKASDVGDVNNIASDIKNQDGKTTVVDAVNNLNNKVGDLQYSKVEKGEIADGDSTTTAIGKLDQKLTDVAATAAKHTKVEGSSNITVTNTAKEGEAANYKVELKKDIEVNTVNANSVTTGQTVMNKDGLKVGEKVSVTENGLKVGDKVSVTENAVTAGQTSISDAGVKVGENTYISDKGLNANSNKITNVADGEENSDAVNYGQLKKSETTINNRIDGVENQVISNSNRINKVGAGAAALAALHPLDFDPDDKWDFAAGYGNYNGENAAAIGAYYRPNEDTMFSVGGSFGNGENMVNAGISLKLGQGNHVSTSKVAMAKEIKDLRKELEGLKSALLDVNAGKKLDTSKLQLFPDVPKNHWAYEYVSTLKGNGVLTGYPDGEFKGDRPMTRYEFATMLYKAMLEGATLSDRILKEFAPELERFTVDTVHQDKDGKPTVERVRTVKAKK